MKRGTGRVHVMFQRSRSKNMPENRAAYHLYRKQGFIEEGVMKREVLVANRWVDLVGMGLNVGRKHS